MSETNSVHASCLFPVSFRTRDRHRDAHINKNCTPFLVAPTRPRLHGFRVWSMMKDTCGRLRPSLRDSSTTLLVFFEPRFNGKESRVFYALQFLRVPIIAIPVFRSSGKRARCDQARTVHCSDVLFRPCSKGTLWTAIFRRNDKGLWFRSTETGGCHTGQVHSGSRRLFPSSRTLHSAFLFSSSSTCFPILLGLGENRATCVSKYQ